MQTPIYRLRALLEALPDLGPDGCWLAMAIRQRLAGTVPSIDSGLNIHRRGGLSAAIQDRNRVRDSAISRYAAQYLPADLSPATAAQKLAHKFKQFEARVWPRLSFRSECPPHEGAEHAALFELFKLGRVPNSPKQLRRILSKDIQSAALNVPRMEE